jgi:seryl-tRNA synthetase
MYDIRWIREHPEKFLQGLKRRNQDADFVLKDILTKDAERRATIAPVQGWQELINRKSKEIGLAKRAGDESRVTVLMEEVSRLKSDIKRAGEQVVGKLDKELHAKLSEIPNIPLDEVPYGTGPNDNVEHHRFGVIKNYRFLPKQHFELGEALDQMDFETAAKLSGARFVVLRSGLARLERALGHFMLDVHTNEHGYTEVAPPLLVRERVMYGTAQLPKFADDQFRTDIFTEHQIEEIAVEYAEAYLGERVDHLVKTKEAHIANVLKDRGVADEDKSVGKLILELFPEEKAEILEATRRALRDRLVELKGDNQRWLIPTAEVPLTNLVRERILDEGALPLRFTALTPCFRAEAGAAGKDTRGMLRQHQFDKVELVSITAPEKSLDEHERMLSCAEEVLRRLDLHYRVVTLCTGDMGFASQKTYDIEVWLPGQGAYREISSCSVCGEFQARRMDARYRGKSDRTVRHVHTLNGSGVAVGRALIAVMETYQDQGGGIAVPDVLQSYMGGTKRIERPAKN